MLSVVMLNVIMLNVTMLNFVMLSVVMLGVVMLNVMDPAIKLIGVTFSIITSIFDNKAQAEIAVMQCLLY
jgi:hypothetical protein